MIGVVCFHEGIESSHQIDNSTPNLLCEITPEEQVVSGALVIGETEVRDSGIEVKLGEIIRQFLPAGRFCRQKSGLGR